MWAISFRWRCDFSWAQSTKSRTYFCSIQASVFDGSTGIESTELIELDAFDTTYRLIRLLASKIEARIKKIKARHSVRLVPN